MSNINKKNSVGLPLVTFIVPVYLTERYINQCVQSILDVDFQNWELILVDDGSPDNCPIICDDWAKKDVRIKVYHQINGGASSARNFGLQQAKGDWVTFIDSDDSITPDYLDACLNAVASNDLDALQFYMKEVLPDGTVIKTDCRDTPVCNLQQYVNSGCLSGCSGGGFYSMNIIRDNHIRFIEKLHYLEDAFFVCDVLQKCSRIKRIPGQYYIYHKHSGGSDIPISWSYYLDSLEFASKYKCKHPFFSYSINEWCTMLIMRYIIFSPSHDYQRLSIILKEINLSKDFLSNLKRRDIKCFSYLMNFFGVRLAGYMTKIACQSYYFFFKSR